jgi:hypothetical protein
VDLATAREDVIALRDKPPRRTRPPKVTRASVLDAVRAADREGRHGGLVPIGDVWARLGAPNRKAAERVLLEMQRTYEMDLKVANDPYLHAGKRERSNVPDPSLLTSPQGDRYGFVVLR